MRERFEAGQFAHVPLLIGRNDDEAGFFPPAFSAQMRTLLGEHWDGARALLAPADKENDAVAARLLAGDVFAGVGTRAIARATAKAGVPTYAYRFAYVPTAARQNALGAVHTADLPYVFGTLPADATQDARRVSRAIGDLWFSFASTGQAQARGVPQWPAYSEGESLLLISNEGYTTGPDPTSARLDFLDRRWPAHIN
jgi:para-nitrobenzyl esterase